MKVLITGADGFIGSHLTEEMVIKGHNVKALCFYNSFNSKGWLNDSEYSKDIEIINGDVRDPFLFTKILKGVDLVFNLAALIAIPYSYESPHSYLDTNVKGCLNLLQGALKNSSKVIQFSTSEVYGTAESVPISENHPLNAQSPYSASKISSDAFAMSYYYSFGLPVSIFRPFNTFGPRQSLRAVIPTIIRQLKNKDSKKIYLGDTTPTRDFNYIKNVVGFIYQLSLSNKIYGKSINVGSNSEISIFDLFQLLQKITKSNKGLIKDKKRLRPKKSEVMRLRCDNSLLKKLIRYKPKYKIEEGLRETVEWFSDENINKFYNSIEYIK